MFYSSPIHRSPLHCHRSLAKPLTPATLGFPNAQVQKSRVTLAQLAGNLSLPSECYLAVERKERGKGRAAPLESEIWQGLVPESSLAGCGG